jgi:hypothetical protein
MPLRCPRACVPDVSDLGRSLATLSAVVCIGTVGLQLLFAIADASSTFWNPSRRLIISERAAKTCGVATSLLPMMFDLPTTTSVSLVFSTSVALLATCCPSARVSAAFSVSRKDLISASSCYSLVFSVAISSGACFLTASSRSRDSATHRSTSANEFRISSVDIVSTSRTEETWVERPGGPPESLLPERSDGGILFLRCSLSSTGRIATQCKLRQIHAVVVSCRKGDALGQAGTPFSTCTWVVTNLFPLRLRTNRQHANSLAIRPPFRSDQLPREFKNPTFKIKMALHLPSVYRTFDSWSNNFATICKLLCVSRLLLLSLPFTTPTLETVCAIIKYSYRIALSFSARTRCPVNGH